MLPSESRDDPRLTATSAAAGRFPNRSSRASKSRSYSAAPAHWPSRARPWPGRSGSGTPETDRRSPGRSVDRRRAGRPRLPACRRERGSRPTRPRSCSPGPGRASSARHLVPDAASWRASRRTCLAAAFRFGVATPRRFRGCIRAACADRPARRYSSTAVEVSASRRQRSPNWMATSTSVSVSCSSPVISSSCLNNALARSVSPLSRKRCASRASVWRPPRM